jgi:hypothetical protein
MPFPTLKSGCVRFARRPLFLQLRRQLPGKIDISVLFFPDAATPLVSAFQLGKGIVIGTGAPAKKCR